MLKNILCISLLLLLISCKKDKMGDLVDTPYSPTTATFNIPPNFPILEQPEDNIMTKEGIDLGRHLFYDTRLSANDSQSCASCHFTSGSFTDNKAVSTGVDGIAGTRSSMSLMNSAFYTNGLFWDGSVSTLEEQALLPVEDPIELHHSWIEVVQVLKDDNNYPSMFRQAFGIEDKSDITKELAVKALAQFERSLLSSGTSKYDIFINSEPGSFFLSDQEQLGLDLFFDIEMPDAECGHCHSPPLFTSNDYENNGLQIENEDGYDVGRYLTTGIGIDSGRMRIPTLRNIEFTAPYMHDGRFQTLEEVMDHYNSGGHPSRSKSTLIRPLGLDEEQKAAIIAFMKTLSEPDFLSNPDFQDPF